MKQLQFSPIPQKHSESIDTISFLEHQKIIPEENSEIYSLSLVIEKLFNNRIQYSMQLLKQFILFSSEESEISNDYPYMYHEIQGGVEKLQYTYQFLNKVAIGKAFQDIVIFSKKQQAYHNKENLAFLSQTFNKFNEKLVKRNFFKVLFEAWEDQTQRIRKEKILLIRQNLARQPYPLSEQEFKSEISLSSIKKAKGMKKIASQSITPVRKKEKQNLNHTKKKLSSKASEIEDEIQQIYIVREKPIPQKKPVKFLRIPITSRNVKIVEYTKEMNDSVEFESNSKGKSRNKFRPSEYEEDSHHKCGGCKFCHILKEMKEYRLQRDTKLYKF